MRLKLAIQKSGRLNQDSMQLLKECGIDISNGINQLKADASNFPIEVFFLRDDDIPQYVQDGVADIGFVGENVVYEKAKKSRSGVCTWIW
jgi:ATP phosphoribosyltransferase